MMILANLIRSQVSLALLVNYVMSTHKLYNIGKNQSWKKYFSLQLWDQYISVPSRPWQIAVKFEDEHSLTPTSVVCHNYSLWSEQKQWNNFRGFVNKINKTASVSNFQEMMSHISQEKVYTWQPDTISPCIYSVTNCSLLIQLYRYFVIVIYIVIYCLIITTNRCDCPCLCLQYT